MRLWRSISRDFFTDADVVSVSPLARLLYLGLTLEADREGRFTWQPRSYGVRYLPCDQIDAQQLCDELVQAGLIRLYDVAGRSYAVIPDFSSKQSINGKEAASRLPPPPLVDSRADASCHVLTRGDVSNHDSTRRDGFPDALEGKCRERRDASGEEAQPRPSQAEAVITTEEEMGGWADGDEEAF